MDSPRIPVGNGAFIPPRHMSHSAPPSDAGLPATTPRGQSSRRPAMSSGTKLRRSDYARIIDYLEVNDNYNALFGAGRRTRPGNKYQSKKSAFTSMAAVLANFDFPNMDGANLSKRFGRYQDMYKKALSLKNSSGGGLTEEEIQSGLSLDQKLDKICPLFDRMHAICGARANVRVPGRVSHGFAGCGVVEAQEDMAERSDNEGQDDDEEPTSPAWPHSDSPDETQDDWAQDESPSQVLRNAEAPTEILQSTPPQSEQRTSPPSQQTPTPMMPAEDVAPPPQSASMSKGNEASVGRAKKVKNLETSATSKGSLATMYAEQKVEKMGFRKDLIRSKVQWKKDEIEDRREARTEQAKRDKLERFHKMRVEQFSATQLEKRLRLEQGYSQLQREHDHAHQLHMAQVHMRTQLMSELFKSNKSEGEIGRLMQLVDSTTMGSTFTPTSGDTGVPGEVADD